MSSIDGAKLLEQHGIKKPAKVYYNLSIPELYEETIKRGEGTIGQDGTLVAYTTPHTGRSPVDIEYEGIFFPRFPLHGSNQKTLNFLFRVV